MDTRPSTTSGCAAVLTAKSTAYVSYQSSPFLRWSVGATWMLLVRERWHQVHDRAGDLSV